MGLRGPVKKYIIFRALAGKVVPIVSIVVPFFG